jgi:exosortase A
LYKDFAGISMKDEATVISETIKINGAGLAPYWRNAIILTIAAVTALLSIYYQTVLSMVEIWSRSDTFAHGFLILPITAWLIWRRRMSVTRFMPEPDYRALPLLILLGSGWLISHAADVLVVQQTAVVGMVPVLIWLVLGWRVVWEVAFPLGFLLFAVPVGESLIPSMMSFTADFTVTMLKLTGMPVYREGTFFSIPSSDWSVVEGCSGLRYLIASITLGFLYAYLSYRSLSKRLIFILLAVIFPVIANGLRAYMIVMIAHMSDMKLAMGVDHFIYGWVFFGIVMLFLFWIGSFWTENELPSAVAIQTARSPGSLGTLVTARTLSTSIMIGLAIAAIWPVRASYIDSVTETRIQPVNLKLPKFADAWHPAEPLTNWEPRYIGPDAKAKVFYSDGSNTIGLYLMYYRHQGQGAELINSQNILIKQKDKVWKMPEEKPVKVIFNGNQMTVLQGRLDSASQRLLVWRWNWVSGQYTSNEYYGKLLEAKDRVMGNPKDSVGIVVATEYQDGIEFATGALQRFVSAMLPSLEKSLIESAGN